MRIVGLLIVFLKLGSNAARLDSIIMNHLTRLISYIFGF